MQGVATDPNKVHAVLSWPAPSSIKKLCSFLGLAGYYRHFVKHFGIISRPLTELLKKGALFIWSMVHDAASHALKQALTTITVPALLDFFKTILCGN